MKQYKAAMTEQIRNLADMSGLRAEEIRLSVNEDVSSDSYGCPTEVSMHVLSEDGMEADNGSKKQFRQLLSQQLGMAESQIDLVIRGREADENGRFQSILAAV